MSVSKKESSKHVIRIKCQDEIGLIHKISNVLYLNKLNIIRNGEYVDNESNQFFLRSEVEGTLEELVVISNLEKILPPGALIDLKPIQKKKIVILGTKEAHCLGDMLIKHQFNNLNAKIQAVICNHQTLGNLVEKFEIPFHCISASGLERTEHEQKILDLLDTLDFDYIVLAKYMRILTPLFVEKYPNQIINIHHSFLPAFIGANPYKQAFERGVKIIGATAHFVTNDLDEGPIINQDVIRVDHNYSWRAMARAGRDVERTVLAQALEMVFKDRVMVNKNKTIIF